MQITRPACYDSFRCIASDCPDSCCREWDVEVDPASVRRYEQLEGELGDRIRQALYTEDGAVYLGFDGGRCPLWREDGLCRIHAELGEEALCTVCTEFPRLHHDYGNFRELGLELSCPEAARILLTAPEAPDVTEEVPGGEAPGCDQEAMAVLKATREEALALLRQDRPIGETLTLLLLYGCQAQSLLDGVEVPDFDPDGALATAKEMEKAGDFRDILDFYAELEILTPQWEDLLQGPADGPLSEYCRPLARYFVKRYWLQAVSDYDLYCRVKFLVASCLVVSRLGGDFIDVAHLYSKEIENDADNMDALLDAAYDHPAFTDRALLGYLDL